MDGAARTGTEADAAKLAAFERRMVAPITVSAILPVAALLIVGVGIYGAASIQEFALALFVGLLVGAYSSLYIATPVVVWMKEREPRNRQIRERLAARADATGGPVDRPAGADRAPVEAGVGAATGTTTTDAPSTPALPANWSA